MLKYIKDLHIKSFRGIRDLKLTDLGDVNILVGENNAGKTFILEAIGILENPSEIGHIIKIGKKREIFYNQSSSYTIFENMLNRSSNKIEIAGVVKAQLLEVSIEGRNISVVTEDAYTSTIDGFEGKIQANYGMASEIKDIKILQTDSNFVINDSQNILPIVQITSIDHLLENSPNEIIKKGKKKELIELLSIFDKNIVGLEMVEESKKTIPYIEHKKLGIMPLSTYGDGLKKVLLIGSSIIKAEKGVLLIDEVETAIHTDVLADIFKWFIKACRKYTTQVFMTTHSIEVIDAILESQKDLNNTEFLEDSLRIITIKNSTDDEKTKVRNLNGLRAFEAREDFGLELR